MQEKMAALECLLFVAGDPVTLGQLERALGLSKIELRSLLTKLEANYENEDRGLRLQYTDETAQLTTKPELMPYIEAMLKPLKHRSFSDSLMETLAVVAYRQPITRAEVENVRGVRCEYAMSQLVKLNMIESVGHKDVIGRPNLYGTTDAFLRQFGLHGVTELPAYESYAKGESPNEEEMEDHPI